MVLWEIIPLTNNEDFPLTSRNMDPVALAEWEALADRMLYLRKYYAADFFEPNPFQVDFFAAGAANDERLLSCGNQSGKTLAGAVEMAFHLTGRYPGWWVGRRFSTPIRALVVGITYDQMRDACLRVLLHSDDSQEIGTGTIPKDLILDYAVKKDANGALDYIYVQYVTGGASYLRTATQGMRWEVIMGDKLHVVWGDESLEEIKYYTQFLARITTTKGLIYITCTPEHGYTPIYHRYENERPARSYLRYGSLMEVTHLTSEEKEMVLNRYPAHERPYRIFGKPFAGSGMVYPVKESSIKELWRPPGKNWKQIIGIDFGFSTSLTAIVFLAQDPDSEVWYVYDRISFTEKTPQQIVPEILKKYNEVGAPIPIAWPRDGSFAERSTGIRIAELYSQLGAYMIPEAAYLQGADGKKTCSVEAGVQEILQMMLAGKFKIMVRDFEFDVLMEPLFHELRVYGRDDEGRIKKTISSDPHHWDAIRYAISMAPIYASEPYTWEEEPVQLGCNFALL